MLDRIFPSLGTRDLTIFGMSPEGSPQPPLNRYRADDVQVESLEVTSDGATVVAGSFSRELEIDSIQVNSNGTRDAFVARIAPDSTTSWVHAFGGDTPVDRATAISLPSGAVIVTGVVMGDGIDVGDGATIGGANPSGFAIRYEVDGRVGWAFTIGGGCNEEADDLVRLETGEILITGAFCGTEDFDLGTPMSAEGEDDVFVLAIDERGTPLWVFQAGGSGDDEGEEVTPAPGGGFYLGGYVSGRVDLGDAQTVGVEGRISGFVAHVRRR